MDLNGALVFVHVVRAGSFTEASRALRIPISTVSDKVAALEKALGVALLIRSTRKLKLTDVGAVFFHRSDDALDALLDAGNVATKTRHVPAGTLMITAPTDFASMEIAEATAECRARFPEVRVVMHWTNRFVDIVAEGYDIALRGGDLDDSSLISRRLGVDSMILVASARYLKSAPPLKHPRDLSLHPCVRFVGDERDSAEGAWGLRDEEGKTFRVKLLSAIAVNSFALAIELVKAGAGTALIPRTLVAGELSKKVLPTRSGERDDNVIG